MSNDLGKRIHDLISYKKITQRELANQVGITYTSLSRYIKGKRIPNSEILAKIAIALHVNTDFLLGIEKSYEFSEEKFDSLRNFVSQNVKNMTQKQKADLILTIMGVDNDQIN